MGRLTRIAALYLLVILGAVEALLWLVPLPDPYNYTVFNQYLPSYYVLRSHAGGDLNRPISGVVNSYGLHGVSSEEAPFTANRLGFLYAEERSRRRSVDELRIGVVGGSTVQCIALVEGKRWPDVLERILSEKIGGPVVSLNLGIGGQDSRSHLATTAQLAVKLDLDYLVYLVGANDLFRTRQPFDPLADKTALVRIEQSEIEWLATRFQLVRYLRAARFQLSRYLRAAIGPGLLPRFRGRYFEPSAANRKAMPQFEGAISIGAVALSDYTANLISLDALGRAHGIKSIFLTQPALWKKGMSDEEDSVDWMGFTERDGREYRIPGETSARLLEILNAQLLATCQTNNLTCLNLAAVIPRDLDHFYDSVHFNERGAELTASTVANFIANQLKSSLK
jgi:lysophospholipase L1-like esterase